MVNVAGLFGQGGAAYQLFVYGVLQQVVGAIMAPGLVEIQQDALGAFENVAFPYSDAATAVARGLMGDQSGKDAASAAGFSGDLFEIMVKLAHHAPDLSAVIVAYRRGDIPLDGDNEDSPSLKGALTDAGIPAAWHDIVVKAAVQEPTVAEVMNAWLEGQIDESEAKRRYLRAGGDPTWFQTSYDANGEAPTPIQALDLWNRGIIPESGTGPDAVSYQQAFLEGPWRNKWLAPFKELRKYLPPPRTVTAMLHGGQMSHDQAAQYLAWQGLQPDLIALYLSDAHTTKTAAEKVIAKGDATTLYLDGLITKPQFIDHLKALKYTDTDAQLLAQLADIKVVHQQYTGAVAKVRAQYLAGQLKDNAASALLGQLGVPAGQIAGVVATWKLEVQKNLRTLTSAQIEQAWYYTILTDQQAMDALQGSGYSAIDAWTLLSIKNKGPLTSIPRPGGAVV